MITGASEAWSTSFYPLGIQSPYLGVSFITETKRQGRILKHLPYHSRKVSKGLTICELFFCYWWLDSVFFASLTWKGFKIHQRIPKKFICLHLYVLYKSLKAVKRIGAINLLDVFFVLFFVFLKHIFDSGKFFGGVHDSKRLAGAYLLQMVFWIGKKHQLDKRYAKTTVVIGGWRGLL